MPENFLIESLRKYFATVEAALNRDFSNDVKFDFGPYLPKGEKKVYVARRLKILNSPLP